MLQMGELEAVQHLIGQETAHYQSLIEFLRETVKEPLVAGMLLGKTERAREIGFRAGGRRGLSTRNSAKVVKRR